MDRRSFLSSSVAATAATALSANGIAQAQPAPAVLSGAPEIVVIGAGAFGAWTALTLRERGHKVLLLDAYGPGNSRSSSGDESRHLRAGYDEREVYSDWAFKAMALWQEREKEFGRTLMYPAPRLQMARAMSKGLTAQK